MEGHANLCICADLTEPTLLAYTYYEYRVRLRIYIRLLARQHMAPTCSFFSQRKRSVLGSPCLHVNAVSVDASLRSTEFGYLSHVRMIIHSYIQID